MKITGSIAASLLAVSFAAFPEAQADPADSTSATDSRLPAGPVTVPVFYITNRQKTADKEPLYTTHRSESVHYGVRNVTLTPINAAKVKYDRAITTVDLPDDTFFNQLTAAQQQRPSKKIVVYVHGYSMNMDVSSKVAARMGTELQLPVVMFSWPSRRNPLTYMADESMAEWASFQLSNTLEDLGKRYGKDNLILVGHSVGCRMICWSLQHEKAANHDTTSKYKHIFLCSPDIDSEVFKKYATLFPEFADDTRIFASYRDVRLCISKLLHGGIRLGMMDAALKKKPATVATSPKVPLVEGIQTIDYTEDDPTIFGHAIPFNLLYQVVEADQPQSAIAHHAPAAVKN